jgi:hypothetical protein
VLVDDDVVGTSPLTQPLLLNAGEHRLSVRKGGYRQRIVRKALAGRDDVTVTIDLEALPEEPRVVVVGAPRESSRTTWRWVTWSATGVLTVGAATALGLGAQAASDLHTLVQTKDVTKPELDSKAQTANGLLLAADILGGAAIAAGAAALYITIAPTSGDKAPALAPHVGLAVAPGWVGVRGTY